MVLHVHKELTDSEHRDKIFKKSDCERTNQVVIVHHFNHQWEFTSTSQSGTVFESTILYLEENVVAALLG